MESSPAVNKTPMYIPLKKTLTRFVDQKKMLLITDTVCDYYVYIDEFVEVDDVRFLLSSILDYLNKSIIELIINGQKFYKLGLFNISIIN